MKKSAHKILYIATEYTGGMRPYAYTILKTMWNDNAYAIIVVKDEKIKNDFNDIDCERLKFITYPTKKINKLFFRLFPIKLVIDILRIVRNEKIDFIYTLTEELVLAWFFSFLQRNVEILHTVHDVIHHDTKYLSTLQRLKDLVFKKIPNRRLIRLAKNLVTNSHDQEIILQKSYPYKRIFYAPFPSLINDMIVKGGAKVSELKDWEDYILFFGNLQLYKGVHDLYRVFCESNLNKNYKLVIAGAGNIYFKRDENEKNILFINRFIRDEELRDLFMRASIVVYPYLSATQSGVLSIASYFGKKILLSDIPFFRYEAQNIYGVSFVNVADKVNFVNAIEDLIGSNAETFSFYSDKYDNKQMCETLWKIYEQIKPMKRI